MQFGVGIIGPRKRLNYAHKSPHTTHQVVHRRTTVVPSDDIVELLPQSFDRVHPRVIAGLEQQFELGVVLQLGECQTTFVNAVVIDDENDASGAAVACPQVLQ